MPQFTQSFRANQIQPYDFAGSYQRGKEQKQRYEFNQQRMANAEQQGRVNEQTLAQNDMDLKLQKEVKWMKGAMQKIKGTPDKKAQAGAMQQLQSKLPEAFAVIEKEQMASENRNLTNAANRMTVLDALTDGSPSEDEYNGRVKALTAGGRDIGFDPPPYDAGMVEKNPPFDALTKLFRDKAGSTNPDERKALQLKIDSQMKEFQNTIDGKGVDQSESQEKIARNAAVLARKEGRDKPNQEDIDKATQAVDGTSKIVVTDTGVVKLINELTNEQSEVQMADLADGGYPEVPQSETLYNKALLATGPGNVIMQSLALPAAWAGMDVGKIQVEAKQTLQTHSQQLIRALSVNQRYPVAEQERIKKEIQIEPKFWDDPTLMQSRMRSIDTALNIRATQAERDFNNPKLPIGARGDAAKAAADIRGFLAIMGVPSQAPDLSALPPKPDGVSAVQWQHMTPEGRELFK